MIRRHSRDDGLPIIAIVKGAELHCERGSRDQQNNFDSEHDFEDGMNSGALTAAN